MFESFKSFEDFEGSECFESFKSNLHTNLETVSPPLDPATDIGSALTAEILQPNGQFVSRSTLRHLTDEELQSSVHLDK